MKAASSAAPSREPRSSRILKMCEKSRRCSILELAHFGLRNPLLFNFVTSCRAGGHNDLGRVVLDPLLLSKALIRSKAHRSAHGSLSAYKGIYWRTCRPSPRNRKLLRTLKSQPTISLPFPSKYLPQVLVVKYP